MGKLTKGQVSILKALAKGDTIKGNLADPAGFYPAKAVLKRARRPIEPSDVEAQAELTREITSKPIMGTSATTPN